MTSKTKSVLKRLSKISLRSSFQQDEKDFVFEPDVLSVRKGKGIESPPSARLSKSLTIRLFKKPTPSTPFERNRVIEVPARQTIGQFNCFALNTQSVLLLPTPLIRLTLL
jgi:hypothetical protein